MLFPTKEKAYCILKTKVLSDLNETVSGVMRHPLYKDKPLVIDDKHIAQQYLDCLQEYETTDITYKLVSSEQSYPLWVYN